MRTVTLALLLATAGPIPAHAQMGPIDVQIDQGAIAAAVARVNMPEPEQRSRSFERPAVRAEAVVQAQAAPVEAPRPVVQTVAWEDRRGGEGGGGRGGWRGGGGAQSQRSQPAPQSAPPAQPSGNWGGGNWGGGRGNWGGQQSQSQPQATPQATPRSSGGWDGNRRGTWGGQAQSVPQQVPQATPSGGGWNRGGNTVGNAGGNTGGNGRGWGGQQTQSTPQTAPSSGGGWQRGSNGGWQNGGNHDRHDGDRQANGGWNNGGLNNGGLNNGGWQNGVAPRGRTGGVEQGRHRDNDHWNDRSGRSYSWDHARQTWGNNWNGRNDRWDRGWRSNNRYDWYGYRSSNRDLYRADRYYNPYGYSYGYNRFSVGIYLSSLFYDADYWIDDPWSYRLPQAGYPYRWVRYYDDVLLVDVRSGYVVDVIYDFFW